jgi:hypothetical protein
MTINVTKISRWFNRGLIFLIIAAAVIILPGTIFAGMMASDSIGVHGTNKTSGLIVCSLIALFPVYIIFICIFLWRWAEKNERVSKILSVFFIVILAFMLIFHCSAMVDFGKSLLTIVKKFVR